MSGHEHRVSLSEGYYVIETTWDALGACFHTAPPAGYCVIRDHVGCIGLGIRKVHYSFAV